MWGTCSCYGPTAGFANRPPVPSMPLCTARSVRCPSIQLGPSWFTCSVKWDFPEVPVHMYRVLRNLGCLEESGARFSGDCRFWAVGPQSEAWWGQVYMCPDSIKTNFPATCILQLGHNSQHPTLVPASIPCSPLSHFQPPPPHLLPKPTLDVKKEEGLVPAIYILEILTV